MSNKKDTPYYVGLGIVIIIFGYFAVTNVIDYVQKNKVVDSNRSEDRIPVADNVIEYAVTLVGKTRPNEETAASLVKEFVDWGAGPRASQNLILAAKTYAATKGKFSPDIEDVQAVATGILRHRIIKNYKAEAEGVSDEKIIQSLF